MNRITKQKKKNNNITRKLNKTTIRIAIMMGLSKHKIQNRKRNKKTIALKIQILIAWLNQRTPQNNKITEWNINISIREMNKTTIKIKIMMSLPKYKI